MLRQPPHSLSPGFEHTIQLIELLDGVPYGHLSAVQSEITNLNFDTYNLQDQVRLYIWLIQSFYAERRFKLE